MSHKLEFEEKNRKVLDANVSESDRYEIYDPRNPINQRRRGADKESKKQRQK
jgi:peptidyl-prolyl cis-trans isomerase SDCCAG10